MSGMNHRGDIAGNLKKGIAFPDKIPIVHGVADLYGWIYLLEYDGSERKARTYQVLRADNPRAALGICCEVILNSKVSDSSVDELFNRFGVEVEHIGVQRRSLRFYEPRSGA